MSEQMRITNNYIMRAVIEACDELGVPLLEVYVDLQKVVFTTSEPKLVYWFLFSRSRARKADIYKATRNCLLEGLGEQPEPKVSA